MTKSCRNSACVCMSFPRVSITAEMPLPPPKFLLFKTYFFQVVQRSHYKQRCRRPGPMYERSEEGELQFSSFSSLTTNSMHKQFAFWPYLKRNCLFALREKTLWCYYPPSLSFWSLLSCLSHFLDSSEEKWILREWTFPVRSTLL